MSDKYNKEQPSVLQKIQNQTGCLLLVIGVAMLAFVLTDLFSSGGSLFGGSSANSVGSIAGEEISYQEYDTRFQEIKNTVLTNNPGFQFNAAAEQQYRQQTWDLLVEEKIENAQYEELGLAISPAELEDLTVGNNTHPQIQQSFRDPESGEFNKLRLIRFLKEDVNNNPQAKASWDEFQKQFTKGLVKEKYNTLLTSSFYSTQLDATNEIRQENQTFNAEVVSLAYASVPDSTISVSDSELKSYIKEHKSQFEQRASRDIEFISLKVVPSKADSMRLLENIAASKEKFAETEDDSAFVSLMNSERLFTNRFSTRGSFDPSVEEMLFNAPVGEVVGPYQNNGIYSLYKVVEEGTDTLPSRRGSHIYFRVSGTDTAAAIADAREVISKINSGSTTFEAEAQSRNVDATRSTGGDMGWVRQESFQFPKRLVNRLMTAPQGSMVVVNSDRGVHILKATSPVSTKTIKVAELAQSLYPSTDTDGEYYRTAGDFLTKLGGDKSFEEVAESMGLTKRVASKIEEKERRIPGITNGNIVARWLFDPDTEEGDISTILDIDDNYIVARVTKIREAGLPDVDDVRSEVETFVRNEKKAEQLEEKFEAVMDKAKTADELAKALETTVAKAPAVGFNTGSIPYIGNDPKIVGSIMGTTTGKRSDIVKGTNAVAVVYTLSENQFELPEISAKQMELNQTANMRYASSYVDALLEKYEVKDQRYRFYD
jgi:peptidyl-prolyl cis-trans isomerase D